MAIAGNTLRILSLDKLGDAFNAEAVPLRYTPRRMASHSISGNLVVVEADHNAYNEEEKAQLYEAVQITPPLPAGTVLPDEEEAEGVLMEEKVGVPRAQPGKWASCIRVVDPILKETLSVIELSENEVRRPRRRPPIGRASAHCCARCPSPFAPRKTVPERRVLLLCLRRHSRSQWCRCETAQARPSSWSARSRT